MKRRNKKNKRIAKKDNNVKEQELSKNKESEQEKMEQPVAENEQAQSDAPEKSEATDSDNAKQDKKVVNNDAAEENPEKEQFEQNQAQPEAEKTELELKQAEIEKLTALVSQLNDKYLRLSAEFDNYRKRTLKEKTELIKSASSEILLRILPVIDNFERAMKSMEVATEVKPVKDGVDLIYNNFVEFTKQQGLKEIPAMHEVFDAEVHEAVTKIPAPEKELKGKIVDVIEKGYYLHDKIIRFAKVVIGE